MQIMIRFLFAFVWITVCYISQVLGAMHGMGDMQPLLHTDGPRLDSTISVTFYENRGVDINVSEWNGGRFSVVSPSHTDVHLLTSRYDVDMMLMWYTTDTISDTVTILFKDARLRYRCLCGSDQESTILVTINTNDIIQPVEMVHCSREYFDPDIDIPLLQSAQDMLLLY